MESGQLYQQHFNLIDSLTVQEIDLEPHTVKLDTLEEELDKASMLIARALEYKYCKYDEKGGLFREMVRIRSDIRQVIGVEDGIMWATSPNFLTPIAIKENILQNRSAHIHNCIHCGTGKEEDGVDIYNIVCDKCLADRAVEKMFLDDEDYKHETLIIFDEE